MTNIAIVDANQVILQQFSNYFQSFTHIQIVCTAQTVEQLEAHLSHNPTPNILFLDINLPNETGLEALPRLKTLLPDTNIIMFTDKEDSESLFKAFCLGATGYILKETTVEDLAYYIEIVQRGGSALSAKMAQIIIEKINSEQKLRTILSEREYQILEGLAEGSSYKMIADKVGLSVDGVRFYIKRLYRTLNVNSKGEAVYIFFKNKGI